MAAIKSPAKILKLWNKINSKYGSEEGDGGKGKEEKKKPTEKEKLAEKQNEKIDKGLTVLKYVAKEGVTTPSQVKKFETTRDKAAKVMMVYCKTLKGAKMDSIKDMTKFRKSVRQLTVAVRELSAIGLDNTDEGDIDLNALVALDDSKLDALLDDPNLTAGDDISFDEPKETDGQIPTAPPLPGTKPAEKPKTETPPVPPPTPPKGTIARLNALTPHYLEAMKVPGADTSRMKMLFQTIGSFVKNKDLVQAGLILNELEPIVWKTLGGKPSDVPPAPTGKIPTPPPPPGGPKPKAPTPPPVSKEATEFQKRVEALRTQAAALTDPAQAKEVKLLLSAAEMFDRKKQPDQANATLDRAEAALKNMAPTNGTTPPIAPPQPDDESDPDETEEAPKDLASAQKNWKAVSDNTLGKLRVLAKKVAGSNHAHATKAVIELNAVIKQVTKSPDTQQKVKELEKWLKDDDVVADVCELSFDLRKPLLKGLTDLKQFVSA